MLYALYRFSALYRFRKWDVHMLLLDTVLSRVNVHARVQGCEYNCGAYTPAMLMRVCRVRWPSPTQARVDFRFW